MLEFYHRELLNFIFRKVRDREVAADLTQESYVRVLSVQSSGKHISDIRALLYSTARNLVIDQHRRAVHRRHSDIDDLSDTDQLVGAGNLQPEEHMAYRQRVAALVKAIESLPPRCKEAFLLNRFDGLSHQEVAQRMGISKNMVAQHVARGILTCQDCLDEMPASSQSAGDMKVE